MSDLSQGGYLHLRIIIVTTGLAAGAVIAIAREFIQ
jgi:hypothetical protein